MEVHDNLLLIIAVILLLARVFESISKKIKVPPVIGLLILGIIMGPSVTNLVKPNEIISWLAKLGVLFLLFEAGLETDIKRIKEDSKMALLPALGGILVPFVLGGGICFFFYRDMIQSLVTGIIFTATSVSISVVTLIELQKLRSIEGRTIVNAAIIDDIVGILLVTIVFGLVLKSGTSDFHPNLLVMFSIGKIILFFAVIIIAGNFLLKPLFQNLNRIRLEGAFLSIAIAFIFLYSWFAESTGIAAITGAYFAGLFLGQTDLKEKIHNGITTFGKGMFIDLFFIHIGLELNLLEVNASPIFISIFIVFAILGKIGGSGLGCRLTGLDSVRSLRIGSGMIPRGEVALIVANMALDKHLINHDILSATILMVILSAIVTPFLLRFTFIKLRKDTF